MLSYLCGASQCSWPWPLLALPQDPFTRSYFTFYVALSFIWGHLAMCITTFIPIYEYFYPDEDELPAPAPDAKAPEPSAAPPAAPPQKERMTPLMLLNDTCT